MISARSPHRRHSILVQSRRFDGCGDVAGQLLGTLESASDAGHFEFSRCYLPKGFTTHFRSRKFAFMTGQHPPKDWCCTFLRLRMDTPQADQALRAVLARGEGA